MEVTENQDKEPRYFLEVKDNEDNLLRLERFTTFNEVEEAYEKIEENGGEKVGDMIRGKINNPKKKLKLSLN